MKLCKKLCLCLMVVMALLLCTLALPQTAQAADESDLTFTLNETGDGYIVSDCYQNASGEIIIPATYNGLPVTGIGDEAFLYCPSLTSITIPDSVTSIGDSAFFNCYRLTSITIPDGVTAIPDSAFSSCYDLTSITIPDSVTSIGDNAFYYCKNLTNITIPASVTSIASSAFYNCYNLTSVTIPDSVTRIGSSAFFSCSSLTYNVYSNCNYLGNENNPYVVLVGATTKTLRSYKIHPDTKVIYDSAFSSCTSLTSVTIPDSVTSIGDKAFYNCSSLTSVTIPDSGTTIGGYAFYGCASLTSITIPDSVTSIGNYAFSNCSNLTNVTIGNSVTAIGDYAFESCYSLESITIPDSVTSIGDKAFQYCSRLTSITIPDSVTSIGDKAFYNCYNLTSITIPDGVTSIGDEAFYNCNKLTSITIPDSVTTIGDQAFQKCSKVERITIGSSVTTIGMQVFSDCPALTTVALRDSVTYIADEAFYGCDALETVIYCGTNGKWAAMDRTTGNDALENATLQLHNYVKGVCTICGQLESGATAVTLSAPEGVIYRGDTVTITVSTDKVEHCAAGGFLFDFDADIFEYVSGEALVSGFSAAGISTTNGKIAGYFMNGDETLEGAIFQITLRVKEDVDFADYTISGIPSLSIKQDGLLEQIPCEAFGTTVSVACRHSFGDWIEIDETWHKHICAICSFEETLYIEYSVTFRYADGTVISAATYHYGDTVIVPQPEPQNPNSYFTGWDKEIAVCTGDAVYTAIFVDYIPGDIDGDGEMTYNDAIYLLLNQMFGDENYPLSTAPVDIDGNGTVNLEDAIYLLLRNLFGEEFYPLKKD